MLNEQPQNPFNKQQVDGIQIYTGGVAVSARIVNISYKPALLEV